MSLKGATIPAAAILLAMCGVTSCRTSQPPPGTTRPSFATYGVETIEVVAVAVQPPGDASDAELRLTVTPPALLSPGDTLSLPAEAEGLGDRFAADLSRGLETHGFVARPQPAQQTTVLQLLEDARRRGADATLVVRFVPITQITTGTLAKTEARRVGRNRMVDTPTTVYVDSYKPEPRSGLLLLATAQLFDARTGVLLYRSPRPTASRGDIPSATSDLLDWGITYPVSEDKAPQEIDEGEAITRAAERTLAGLSRRSPTVRGVDETAARRAAVVEPVEARQAWLAGLTVGAGSVRFPAPLDLGAPGGELEADAPRRLVLEQGALFNTGAYGAGVEVGYRWQRLLLVGHLQDSYLPGSTRRTYVRTDPDAARAFPVVVGPAHDVGFDLLLGYQRLLWPWLGVRAGGGPLFVAHIISGDVPRGSRLDIASFALGGAVLFEPYTRLGPVELGLTLRGGLGFDFAGGPYGSGSGGLRLGIEF